MAFLHPPSFLIFGKKDMVASLSTDELKNPGLRLKYNRELKKTKIDLGMQIRAERWDEFCLMQSINTTVDTIYERNTCKSCQCNLSERIRKSKMLFSPVLIECCRKFYQLLSEYIELPSIDLEKNFECLNLLNGLSKFIEEKTKGYCCLSCRYELNQYKKKSSF